VPSPALITLTTDFGFGSPYVAAMKGVLLERCPGVTVVDVTHEVPPFDVDTGAFLLWAGTRNFPTGSIHVAVVDPGVGGPRRAVAFAAAGFLFVGPDNGVFGEVLARGGGARGVVLERPTGASLTFEGRDVFAPVAARLACGEPLEALGPTAADFAGGGVGGDPRVAWIDRFGNLVTNVEPPVAGVRVNGREVRASARTYSEAPAGEPFLYTGSLGLVEVGVARGRADQLLGAAIRDRIELLSR
jgi:S-adenosylmethionine hydrolase